MHRFEDLAQQLIEASLARVLNDQLKPNDVLRALVRAIEDARAATQIREPLAPNHFWVLLNDTDLQKLQTSQPALANDLSENVRQILLQMGFRLDSMPRILLRGSDEVPPHQLRVNARWIANDLPKQDTNATPAQRVHLPRRPFLIVDGRRQIDLVERRVKIGRSRNADVIVDDLRVSRKHIELRWQDGTEKFLAVDVGSSGGTKVNGYPIQQCPLEAGDVLSLNGFELIYGEEFSLTSTNAALRIETGSTKTQKQD
jgi:hypothetical protein